MPDRLVVDLEAGGHAKVLSWLDGGLPEEVARAPLTWPLDADALEDLRWYLEDYLLAPYGVWEDRGPAIREKLPQWGEQVFGSVFADGPARFAYEQARDRGLEVIFRSADPGLLGLPWELMRDGSGPVALAKGGISRSLPVADGAGTLEVPGGKLRVLMVISRPAGRRDVPYQMVARPLLERLDMVRGEVNLTVLRPPTFGYLRQVVRQAAEAGEPFHVVHFDGHGTMPGRSTGSAGEGALAFELPGGGTNPVGASKVAEALAEGRVPVVVLNACQSGAVGKELEASVATALLKAGCAAVVAMAYSVYAVAAAEFMAAFYESLFAGETVGQAVTVGRKRLFDHNARPSGRGGMPLADWLVPVHYLRREVHFPQARVNRAAAEPSLNEIRDQVGIAVSDDAAVQDSLAAVDGVFVGRDDLFYQLESAVRERVAILAGPGGTGKTELAKGFARWWRDTGGVDDPRLVFWHSFEPGPASFGLEGVVTAIGLEVFGADFALLGQPQRLEALKQLMTQHRALLIWDNFESVKEMPDSTGATPALDEAASAEVKAFLDWVRDLSASAVLITSRTQETWLGQVRRISVGGLNRGEAAQYASHLLTPYPGAQRHRESRSFGDLLDWLDGHPLAMRLTLPRLNATGPAALLSGLRGTSSLLADDISEADRHTSLPASIAYSYTHLTDQTRRLLPAVSLFYGTADADVLTLCSATEGVPRRFAGISNGEWSAALADAARVGLLTGLGMGMYQIHPALPGYLVAAWRAENPAGYDQERQAAEQALCAASAGFSEWLTGQIESGNGATAYAMLRLQSRTLSAMLGHALDHGRWDDADSIVRALDAYWDTRGLGGEAAEWADRVLDATTDSSQAQSQPARSLWLYTTIQQASRRQQAGQPEQAVRIYLHALGLLPGEPVTGWARKSVAVIYHQLGVAVQACGRLDEAEEWYRKSLAICEELGDRLYMAGGYHELGRISHDRGQLDAAVEWYRKSLAVEEELGNRPYMASTYHELGRASQDRGQLDAAMEWYRKSLAISEELGDRPGLARTYYECGLGALHRGSPNEAEEWYRKSLSISEELGDKPSMSGTYHGLGLAAHIRGRVDEAEEWYRKSLAVSEELGNRPHMALVYAALGLLAEERGQLALALTWNIRCVSLFDEFPSPLTGTGTSALTQLARQLGLPALEETWRQIVGQPLPTAVRDYVTSQREGDLERHDRSRSRRGPFRRRRSRP